MQLSFTPAWALGDAGNVRAFPVLSGIECLTIVVDNDEGGTGQRAAPEWLDALDRRRPRGISRYSRPPRRRHEQCCSEDGRMSAQGPYSSGPGFTVYKDKPKTNGRGTVGPMGLNAEEELVAAIIANPNHPNQ
jgi:hypothetical protein